MTHLCYTDIIFSCRGSESLKEIIIQSIQKFGFINGVDNVNWPPYRDSKSF